MKSTSSLARVRVPATTANLGPGFDTLGIALTLYNTIHIQLQGQKGVKWIMPKGRKVPQGAIRMVQECLHLFEDQSGHKNLGIRMKVTGDVPVARGLGSSVTVRLGVLAGLNELLKTRFSRIELLKWVSQLEGHSDNAAPAVMGGFVVSGIIGDQVLSFKQSLPGSLKLIAAIPNFEVSTSSARKILPPNVSRHDAILNINRVSLLVAAICQGRFEELGVCFEDRMHQPQRSRLVPQLYRVLNAAHLSGALGGWLSGSGSTIMALAKGETKRIAAAMQDVFKRDRIDSQILSLHVDNTGYRIL